MAPSTPVIIIAATVTEGIPFKFSETSIPIGVVTDLGTKDNISSLGRFNILPKIIILIIPQALPRRIPTIIGSAFFFKCSILL
ncbi:hypothetical protein SDC9_96669 [bioreactor metagenome]|uniref:Uncharacterized protein n=1 Tax=bioreactor metagenome TaxID=1076179 RepID=A0A645A9P4_9ZZZZ